MHSDIFCKINEAIAMAGKATTFAVKSLVII